MGRVFSYAILIANVFQTVPLLIQQGTCAGCKSSCKRRMIETSCFCRRKHKKFSAIGSFSCYKTTYGLWEHWHLSMHSYFKDKNRS